MKTYAIEGVEGVFLHLETPMEQDVLSSLCGVVGGVGKKRILTNKIYDALYKHENNDLILYDFEKETALEGALVNLGLVFKGEEPT